MEDAGPGTTPLREPPCRHSLVCHFRLWVLTTSTPGLAAKPSAVKSLPEPQEWQAYHFYSDHWFLLVKMVLIKVTNAAFISAALGRHPAEGEIRALCEASERPALQRGSPLGTQFSCSSPQGTATGMSG